MRIKQLINKVIAPITEEFVFFFFCLVLLLPRTMMFPFLRPDMCFGIWTEFPTLKFISIGIFFSYLFSTLVYVTKSCLIKGFVYLVLYLLFFLNIYLAFSFAATVSPNTLLLLFETTPSEAHDFLSTYAFTIKSFIAYVLIIVVLLVNVLLEYKKGAIRKYLISNKTFMKCKAYVKNCLLMLLVCGLFTSQTSFSLFSIRKVEDIEKWNSQGIASMDLLTGFMYSVRHLELMGDILSIAEISTEKAVAMHHDLLYSEDSCNVVLVIGESFIKAHSSLYGYGLDTNPRLMKEKSKGRLITFSDVVTPYSGTSSAIRNVMSCNSIGNGEKWCDSPYFPAIFKKAGYDVYFWDNQFKPTSSANFDFSLNSYLHSPIISSLSYTAWHEQISFFDGDIVEDFGTYKKNNIHGNKNLVIFHLQGQHFDQKTRYPQTSEFLKFTSKDINRSESWMTDKKKTAIAHYDNCTQYNDSVIASLLSLFKDEPTVMVYFPDHGECIYDFGDFAGRGLDISSHGSDYVRCLFNIPFIVWCSDKYSEQYPKVIEKIRKASDKPVLTDIICHFLITLGGVKSEVYDSSRDALSDDYNCPKRIVDGSYDYDDLTR